MSNITANTTTQYPPGSEEKTMKFLLAIGFLGGIIIVCGLIVCIILWVHSVNEGKRYVFNSHTFTSLECLARYREVTELED